MNSLYTIIQLLRNASGNIEKQAILDANRDNELFRAYMQAVYDVGINYYMKKLPKVAPGNLATMDAELIKWLIAEVGGRKITGSFAATCVKQTLAALDTEGQELLGYIIDRKIGASVGDTMVLKTWPGMYFLPPYQRCSLLDKKARERFGKLTRFYVQTKADGSFAYVVKRLDGTSEVITRQGGKYPQWFAEKLTFGMKPGTVLVGELLVDETRFLEGGDSDEAVYHVDRKTANGLLTSALKDGDKLDDRQYKVRMEAWDLLTEAEFVAGKSDRIYDERFDSLVYETGMLSLRQITIIQTDIVSTLEEAFAIYQLRLQEGLEGCIIKDPASLWKDGTAKDMVKLKIKFQVEMRVKRLYEGEGKAKGTMGGAELESEDGGIENNCGSGFDDKQRKLFWEQPQLILNMIVMVEANDITTSRDGKKKPALSLPIFCEIRADKTVADTTERIYAQLEAAKQGS